MGLKFVALLCVLLPVFAQDNAKKKSDVRRPPGISKGPTAPNQHMLYRSNERIELECEASGDPHPTFSWLKNQVKLDLNAHPNIRLKTNDMGTIIFEPASVLDPGYYQCIAASDYGKAMSNVIFLQQATLETYKKEEPKVKTVNEGDPLEIPCEPVKSIPKPTYSWEIVKTREDETPVSFLMNERVDMDINGNLHFVSAKPADAQENKLYKCKVFNNYLDLTTGGSYTRVQVNPVASVPARVPINTFRTTTPLTVLEGDEMRLRCLFSGVPLPIWNWMKVNGNLPAGRYEYDSSHRHELRIRALEQSDAAQYKCSATNTLGPSQPTAIDVIVDARPRFTHGPKSLNATQGKSATFLCETYAKPEANVLWFKNGEELNPNMLPERFFLSPDGKNLTIVDLMKIDPNNPDGPGDLMNIQCNASNAHGFQFADGFLNVWLPVTLTLRPEDVKIEAGMKEILLKCAAKGDPIAEIAYDWAKDDRRIQYDKVRVLTPEGYLKILLSEASDYKQLSGKYTCIASDGIDFQSADAVIDDAGVAPIHTSGIGDLWWIFVILAIILLLLILCLCCCLCYQRNKGDTYPVDEKERADGHDPEKELADSGFHDYQRPNEGPVKGSRASLNSSMGMDSDDEGSLAEYGDIDAGKFNEDGSFIGVYKDDNRKKGGVAQHPVDSTV